ncbi:SusC/RagA family TonB-linked outer membrane protein [Paradesertivirga mongoliensis]|uniref:SusC/RagA family TonB-linked outer membrane protein n=1 Tax=Paradesertivirga mongoliensis TaxID=2100740 RepID=A0ABW4ZM56_9SPHI|nr:SusC/RagA family TonB-linked outer membrane protein [Pedobacter mongoliensis]
MFKKQIICYLAALAMTCCFIPAVMAQAQVVRGKVTESPSGDALPGVSVVEINANDRQVNGTTTDEEGNYSLRMADAKNRIKFSFIGSATKVESVNGRSVINVALQSGTELAAVAITGTRSDAPSLGLINTPKRDLVSSVTTVKAELMEREPATSIDQMLQGRAAGVQIVSESGDPGAGADIRIRGVGTIGGGAQPLYIVDGVPITADASYSNSDVARTNPIADINPNDIERIDILKDASAGALYGARAANGVIVITTKRGRPGVTNITFQTQTTLVEKARGIPVLDANQYKAMRLEAEQNNGNINPLHANLRPLVDDPTYEAYLYYQNNTNWFQGFARTGLTQNYNLSVSGGGEAVRYSFTTSFNDQQGSMKALNAKRFTGRFNLDYKVSNKLKLQANIAFTRSKNDLHWNLNGGTPINIALTRTPMLPIYDIDAQGNPQSSYLSLPGFMNGQDNPIAFVNSVSNTAKTINLKPNFTATLELAKGLTFRSQAGIEFIGDDASAFLPPEATGVIWNDNLFNRIQNRDVERRTHNLDNFLSYNRKFADKFKLVATSGVTLSGAKGNRLTTEGYATATGQMRSLGAASGYLSLSSGNDDYAAIRAFGQAQVLFGEDDKYSASFTFAREGNSKFGPGNRFATFPAAGLFWRLSSEPFMKKFTFLNELKLKATIGTSGRSGGINNYQFISQFSTGSAYGDYSGVSQSNPQLDNLKWETNVQKNLGMDLEMFNRRMVIALDFYENHSKDILRNLALPGSSGSSNNSILVNLGSIKNRGVEFDISYDVFKPKAQNGKGFSWLTMFNIAKNVNIVSSLPGGALRFDNQFARFSSQVKEGDALGVYYGLVYKGVYATDLDAAVKDADGNIVYELDGITPRIMRVNTETGSPYKGGDAIFEDFNHDGIINAQDRVKVGNGNPDFYGGLNNTFRYRGLSLTAFINFQYGNDLVNGMRYELERMDNVNNQGITVLRRWRKQGDETNMPRALRDDNRNTTGSTRWIEDGSYARLKSLTLAYAFPADLVKRVKLRGFDMYVTATNLFTLTNYSGPDPEIGLGQDFGFIGVDRGRTPQPGKYTLGLNFKF